MALRGVLTSCKVIPRILGGNCGRLKIPARNLCLMTPQKSGSLLFGAAYQPKFDVGTMDTQERKFHVLSRISSEQMKTLLAPPCPFVSQDSKRTLIQFGFNKGKRKTVKAVVRRFYRLDWGAWIRPRAGRRNHLWRKCEYVKKKSRTHVFCNTYQVFMLDKMVSPFWHRKKYYVNDPYESYHTRPNFHITNRRK